MTNRSKKIRGVEKRQIEKEEPFVFHVFFPFVAYIFSRFNESESAWEKNKRERWIESAKHL